jgi:ribokinase
MPLSKKQIDVVGLGQCSLDFLGRVGDYPALDQKAELADLLVQGGGPAATAMVTLARLGVATALIGRVGGDDYGAQIRAGLEEEGVDCHALAVDPDGSSQVAFIVVDGSGHRNIFWHRGSARPLAGPELDAGLIAAAKVLHLDGLQVEASLAAAQIAREHGVVTLLDGGTFRDGTVELLPLIDHLVVSEKFARQLGGDDLRGTLSRLLDYGARAVTATLGCRGSETLAADGGHFRTAAFPVDAVDTTGCGDVFHGAYIYGLLQDWSLPETLRFSAACAALKTRELGGRTAIPTLAEVRLLLDRSADAR